MAEDSEPESKSGSESKPEILLLTGKMFPLDLTGGEFMIHGMPIFVNEVSNAGTGTGTNVWDGSIVLAKYLEHKQASIFVDKTVLELGSGTGLVGITASALGAKHVYLTDLGYCTDNIRVNVKKNEMVLKGLVTVRELDWTDPNSAEGLGHLNFILASDVVWLEELIQPLAATMGRLLSCQPVADAQRAVVAAEAAMEEAVDRERAGQAGSTRDAEEETLTSARHALEAALSRAPVALVSHQTRTTSADTLFFAALREQGLSVTEVFREDHHPRYNTDIISIYRVVKTDYTPQD